MELDRFDKHILEILTHEDVNLNELSERVNLLCQFGASQDQTLNRS